MKKNVIALAVAAAMAAPLAAQAEVKVSGQLQAELLSLSADDEMQALGVTEGLYLTDAQEGGNPGSGNWGAISFSASEDLGNGMKALAKYGFNVDVDGKTPKQRDSYVGLSGGFGTVLAGTMNNPYKTATVKWDPFLTTSAQARGNFGMSTLHNGYAGNVVAYANKFGMAKVVVGVSIDETSVVTTDPVTGDVTRETRGDHGTHASLNVPVGPVELAMGYHDGGLDDTTAVKVGAKYSAGAMSFAVQYEDLDAGLQANILNDAIAAGLMAPAVTATDGETFLLATGSFTAGANTFAASYGMNEANYVVDGADVSLDNTYMALGMVHSFSKSTSAHVAYTAAEVDGEFGASGVAAGLRVKF